jgi:alanine racemase
MSLSTVISHVHSVPVGGGVSYGGSFIADKETLVATLPIGYADGFLRKYTGACVSVCTSSGEHRARIVGRICMDQCMIDVTGLDVKVGDRVIIFGRSPNSLRELAALADTIEYECLCLISARVPRVKK